MWKFWLGFVSFVVALSAIHGILAISRRVPAWIIRWLALGTMAFSLYSIGNGLYHLPGWEFVDMFRAADEAGVSLDTRRGFALLLIMFWPFASILAGVFGVYMTHRLVRHPDLAPLMADRIRGNQR